MAILPICIYGEMILRQPAREVEKIDNEMVILANDMLETMYNAPGVGLAAPQVGKSVRLIVVDVKNYEEDEKEPYILFNPKVVETEGLSDDQEGCLSFPGITMNVVRPEYVTVKAKNVEGKPILLDKIDGLLSRCIQHEIDHLGGKLFVDKISKADKLLLAGRLKKLTREKRSG